MRDVRGPLHDGCHDQHARDQHAPVVEDSPYRA